MTPRNQHSDVRCPAYAVDQSIRRIRPFSSLKTPRVAALLFSAPATHFGMTFCTYSRQKRSHSPSCACQGPGMGRADVTTS